MSNTSQTVKLTRLPVEDVRVGLGRCFARDDGTPIPGHWKGTEMDEAHHRGMVNVPCREWIKDLGEYRYYMRLE